MQLTINGEPKEVPSPLNVEGLLGHLQITQGRVAVEVNAEVVKKADYARHTLQPGDSIEIVAFVGGG